MDKESFYIYNILASSEEALSTSEISKKIFETYGIRLSRKITQNYLWSYFRTFIKYNSDNYTYELIENNLLLNDVVVNGISHSNRTLNTYIKNAKVQIDYDISTSLETYIRAIAILNYRKVNPNGKNDLIKELNRTIEKLKLINEFN